MANKRLVLNKWNGGITNDPNLGQAGSFAYSEGTEIRTNSKRFEMSRNQTFPTLLTTDNNKIMRFDIFTGTGQLMGMLNGQILGLSNNDIASGNIITKVFSYLTNMGRVETNNGAYGFILTSSNIYKRRYIGSADSTFYSGGILSNNQYVTNYTFTDGTGWTNGGGWTLSSGAQHTTGVNTLSQPLVDVLATETYQLRLKYTMTTGSCSIKIGATTITTISSSNSNDSNVFLFTFTPPTDGATLTFTPTTGCNIKLLDVYTTDYNLELVSSSFGGLSAHSPFLTDSNTIYVGGGNKIIKIDTSLTTWVVTTALAIDLDYEIRGITRIGDQFFIYASNGSGSKQYLWDGSSITVLRQISWIDKPIMNVANFANTDYVITGGNGSNKTQFWRVDGYQLTLLYQNDITTNAYLSRIYLFPSATNAIETIGTKLLIPSNNGIFTYGQFTPGTPYSLNKEYRFHYGEITALYYSERVSNYGFWYAFNGTYNGITGTYYGQMYFRNSYYSIYNPGFLQTNPIFGDCFSNKKNSQRFTLGVKGTTGKNWINVYSQNDDIKGYAEIIIQKGLGIAPTVGSVYSISGSSYTITNVLDVGVITILQCTRPTTATEVTAGTITKVSGTGEATYYADKIRGNIKYITTISDFDTTLKGRFIYNYPENFQEISFAFELITNDSNYSPSIYDFNLYYDETDDGG